MSRIRPFMTLSINPAYTTKTSSHFSVNLFGSLIKRVNNEDTIRHLFEETFPWGCIKIVIFFSKPKPYIYHGCSYTVPECWYTSINWSPGRWLHTLGKWTSVSPVRRGPTRVESFLASSLTSFWVGIVPVENYWSKPSFCRVLKRLGKHLMCL